MERIVIQVENNKADFLKELIGYFDFVEIMKVENIVEPRVYPGANFEIRPKNKIAKIDENIKDSTSLFDEVQNSNENLDISNENEKNIKQLRDAMSVINRLRDKNRK